MLFQVSTFLALAAAVYAQADPSINTPAAVVQCQPAQITFTATRTPVFISIIPGGQPSAAPLADLGQQSASPFTWTANIASGTSITFQIRDSSGAVAYSAPVTVQPSSDSSCLGASGSSAAGSSSAAATTPVASTSAAATTPAATTSAAVSSSSSVAVSSPVSSPVSATAPATTSRATSASVISSASRSGAASSAAASPTSSNAAMPTAKVGLAGLLGLAAAVVMA
ncbi:hypothetical protein FRC11_009390 [Ceratobasidium sp. 423]|nr:hypothetical protein FRC11_009390 [Ceratobasidium sp. 423]